ncbi:hypothetical protein [Streptomyces sp. LN785]|uniref:hypothetical protein n=1 Tax=Streptomyces sp. LN785 TaxID=3112983 RepID=UPI003718CD01
MEHWIQTYRHELLDRTSSGTSAICSMPGEFESYYNVHRPHQALDQAAPLRSLPEPINEPERILT